jgi:hypothetical protein
MDGSVRVRVATLPVAQLTHVGAQRCPPCEPWQCFEKAATLWCHIGKHTPALVVRHLQPCADVVSPTSAVRVDVGREPTLNPPLDRPDYKPQPCIKTHTVWTMLASASNDGLTKPILGTLLRLLRVAA